MAQSVWELAPILLKPEAGAVLNINQFLMVAQRQVNLPPTGLTVFPLYPWLVWNLWKCRNKAIFENKHTTPGVIVLKALHDARSWQEAQGTCTKTARTSISVPEKTLNNQAVQCFVDAAWAAATLKCGMGWCFKNADMGILKQETSSCQNVTSALIAEAQALKGALIAAISTGYRELNCFSDSLSLVSLLNSNSDNNELKSLLFDIRCLSKDFISISFTFIPRLANVLADALAKFGLVSLHSIS